MKYFIEIESIKPNPTAGQDRYAFPGKTQINKDGSQTREIVEVRSMTPEPSHLVSYKPTDVKCNHCGSVFDYKELKEDCGYDGDGDDYPICNICPRCGEPECCELDFENVDEFLKRTKRIGDA